MEEEIARIYPSDKIKSPVHLSIGQEAVSVGVCEALRPDDVVFGTYRSHAYYLAKGGDLKKMVAELYGKATGCAKGKGGSMHLIDAAHGIMGASAVVGTTDSKRGRLCLRFKASKKRLRCSQLLRRRGDRRGSLLRKSEFCRTEAAADHFYLRK